MWITKDSQIALFKVNILPERRWSIQAHNVQLITDAELVEPSLIFAIVYHLPKKLEHKTFDENTPPILHVYGKHSDLGFHSHYDLLQHDYSLQHDTLDINIPTSTAKIFIPVCGVAQQLQFGFTNITNKPSFNKQIPNDNHSPNSSNEDFGIIEIYGYSLQQIPAPRAAIPMLNLSTFFQYKSQDNNHNDSYCAPNDYKLLMTAAECDTMCGYISIQSRYFNQAKELLTRAKESWLKLYRAVNANDDANNERNSFLRQIRDKSDRFKYNALRLETLIAYSMNEHNDFKAQIQSIVNIINQHTPVSDESSDSLLPLQIISKHSRSLIKTLLLTSKDSNEFVQVASFKNIYFIIEKLGCNIKQNICDILSEIFEFNSTTNAASNLIRNTKEKERSSVNNSARKLQQSKPLHIQSIMRQILSIKHNICDAALNLISDCNFEIVTEIFETLIITNFAQIMKLESTKLAYCLRIFELCIDRLHSTPTITSSILTSMVGLMYHPSKRVRNISTSIWRSFLFILPTQILRTNDGQQQQQTEICNWLCDMVIHTDMNREVAFPIQAIATHKHNHTSEDDDNDNRHSNHNNDKSKGLLLEVPMIIIHKMCEIQISWNANDNRNQKIGLLNIKPQVHELCVCLKDRILKLLANSADVSNEFDAFRLLLQSLDFLSCSISDYQVLDELIQSVLSRFLVHLKTSSPSSMMLRVCVEFIEYINGADEENTNNTKFIDITLQILQQFHEWIPHSIHDETFVLAQKLIDINYMFLSHGDFCLIVESLLSKYTLRSAVYQEFKHTLISKIYQRIQNKQHKNDKNLFKLITKMLIFDTAEFKDVDQMIRYFEFGYDWLQHEGFENIYIDEFNLIFMRIITIFNRLLFQTKNQQIVNISTDIVTAIALHFSSSIDHYVTSAASKGKITTILNKMNVFYLNALDIDIGNIQFHSVENITLFLHSVIGVCSKTNSFMSDCIQTLIEQLFKLSFASHFTNITDLCLWTICNFYYEIARDTNTMDIALKLNDTELILNYTTKMMRNPDYKMRRWCGVVLFLRFWFNAPESRTDSSKDSEHETIYQQLLLDFDESVTKPLLALVESESTQQVMQYIDSSNLLFRPNGLLTSNLENEVLIEGRSDTASINQARLKNANTSNDSNRFPGLLNNMDPNESELKIVDVDDMNSDIEDISDDEPDEDEEDEEEDEDGMDRDDIHMMQESKENNTLFVNLRTHTDDHDMEEELDDDVSSTSSDDNLTPTASSASSSSQSMSPSSVSSSDDNMVIVEQKKKKIEIPLLPLDQITESQIQTNIPNTKDIAMDGDMEDEGENEDPDGAEADEQEVDQRGMDADDEREESTESQQQTKHEEEEEQSEDNDVDHVNMMELNAENINFARGSRCDNNKSNNKWRNSMDLEYIDSFLQSISVSNAAANEINDDALNVEDVSVNIADREDECNVGKKEEMSLNDERFEEFRRSNLNDFLVNVPQVKNRKSGWWLKYLNSDGANSDES